MNREDLSLLKEILNRPVDPIKAAGLHPTAEQIEMFAYHLLTQRFLISLIFL